MVIHRPLIRYGVVGVGLADSGHLVGDGVVL